MDITNCSLEFKRSFTGLLKVKETQIRMSIIDQAMNAIDRGIHSGGAMSAVTPLITLYYGGFIKYDVQNPTKREQDYFVLSKGHATATMTSIYADLGYFSTELLKNTRAYYSIVNGHPGPILPGVHVSTGPLGEGICVAQGLAIAGMIDGIFDVFTMTGDGELQEGMAWESIIYAGQHGLSNLCVLVDNNSGQLDTYDRLLYPSDAHLAEQFESFNWNALEVDANSFDGLLNTLSAFKYGNRNGRPTAIICKSRKGVGGFSALFNKHKISMDEQLYANEMELQKKLLKKRENHLMDQMADLSDDERHKLIHLAVEMNIQIECKQDKKILHVAPKVKITKAPVRNKRIQYDGMQLPEIDKNKKYMCCDIIRESMKVFALDERVVSIDSDLGSTSGLEPGISFVDKYRAINVGIAEANMMNIGEAFSLLGYNVWVSTFCPFFNWQVMRRIAVSHQERCEDISNPDGWLNEGHGLDLTFLATASNIDTAVNGATHMGTDDILVFDTIPYLKIIDVSCPQQLLGIMKWIMEGNKGLV
ncbi:MAG: transketolase, partial [Christensenellaceae bacterium]